MSDRDTVLNELFSRQAELPADDFLPALNARIEREVVRLRVALVGGIVLALSAASVLIALALVFSDELAMFASAGFRALDVLAASPIAWLGLFALFSSLAPVLLAWQRKRIARLGGRIREHVGIAFGKS